MHIITLNEAVVRGDGQRLEAGEYVATDLNAFEIALGADRGVAELAYTTLGEFEDETSYGTLIIHPLGYGDALLLTPVLRAYMAKHPGEKVWLACRERSRCVFDGLSYSPGFIDYPIPTEELRQFKRIVSMENVNEWGEDAKTLHACDAKAKRLGLDLPATIEAHRVDYVVSAAEREWATSNYPKKEGVKRIGVQLSASAPNRTVPTGITGAILQRLYERGYEVLMFGAPNSTPKNLVPAANRDRIRNLCEEGLSFRQSAAVAQTCDGVVGPDSVLIHLAGAFDIPAVGMFSVVDWKLRTAYYPKCRVVQVKETCPLAPCHFHPTGARYWPQNGPCADDHICRPLAAIDPHRVVAVLEKQLEAST